MKRLYWAAVTHQERHAAIQMLEMMVGKYGYITDFKRFSDLSISLIIEVPTSHSMALWSDLVAYFQMGDSEVPEVQPEQECTVLFNLSFANGTGNLSFEVPAVE